MYDEDVATPNWFAVQWALQHGVRLSNVTYLLNKPGGRESALIKLTQGHLYILTVIITGGELDKPAHHALVYDATRRHLLNNWSTSKIVAFEDKDADTQQTAQRAMKHTDISFLKDKWTRPSRQRALSNARHAASLSASARPSSTTNS